MTPKVSIIIPVYNVEKYLRQCLDSARNQTLRETEVICVDDGSTDGSGAILDEYAAMDSRFVVVHQENAGQSAARNRGLELARGEYLAFLDSDDWYEPGLCALAFSEAKKYDADISQFSFQNIEGKKKIPFDKCPGEHRLYETLEERFTTAAMLYYTVWSRLYRREWIQKKQIRFPLGCSNEDVYFSTLAALHASRITHCGEVFYNYRLGSGYSQSPTQRLKRLEVIEMWQKLWRDAQSLRLPEKIRNTLIFNKLKTYSRAYRRIASRSLKTTCRERILAAMTSEDWAFLENPPWKLPRKVRLFYDWLGGKGNFLTWLWLGKNP
ncbi:MAG: glycosyltransferase [Planctomycetia bacterium]|nr:glycosyltransferase [Planctomycetia bacterium]